MAVKINVNKNTYIYGLLVLSIIVVLGVSVFVIKPLMDDNKKQQEIIDNRKSVITKLESKKSKLEKASFEFSKLKTNADNINKAIPVDEDRKSAVYQLFSIADTAAINLESISIEVGQLGDSAASLITLNSSQEHLYTIGFRNASYRGIQDFVENANKALRLFDIKAITVTGSESNLEVSMVVGFYSEGLMEVNPDEQI